MLLASSACKLFVTKLKKHLVGEPQLLRPKSAGLKDWSNIASTIEIAFFQTHDVSVDELHDLVKEAVYVAAQNAKKEMFRIAAHGIIFQNEAPHQRIQRGQ